MTDGADLASDVPTGARAPGPPAPAVARTDAGAWSTGEWSPTSVAPPDPRAVGPSGPLGPVVPLAILATLVAGTGGALLNAAMSRVIAVVTWPVEAWRPLPWATVALAVGMLAAHRYGGTVRRESRVLVAGCLALAGGALLGAVPPVAVPQLVHGVVGIAGWLAASAGLGAVAGVAVRRSRGAVALAVGGLAAGSGVGLAIAPALVDLLGAPDLALGAIVIGAIAALALALPWGRRTASSMVAAAVAALLALGTGGTLAVLAPRPESVADPGRVPVAKSLFASIADPEEAERLEASRWSAAGRLDTTVAPSGARWLYLDGMPYGYVGPQGRIRPDGALLPFVLPLKARHVLVVGLGGAQEVRAALESGATTVVVAEPHPGAPVAVARAQAAAGGPAILEAPGVRIVPEEARAYLLAGDDRFDLIVVTLASFGAAAEPARPAGATLLTREAIGDYLAHLAPDGVLAIRVHDDHELWRTFNTAFQAMADAGAPTPTDAIRHLLAVNDGTAGGTAEEIALPTVFVRKSAFTQEVAGEILRLVLDAPFPPLFVPFQEERSALSVLGAEGGPEAAEESLPFDISPARDDRPYFLEAAKGAPWGAVAIAVAVAAATAFATWAAARRPDDFGDLDEDADRADGSEEDRRPDPTDPRPWRHLAVASAAGVACGATGALLVWRLQLVAGRPDLASAAAGAALAGGAVVGALAVHRAKRGAIRAVAGWGALAAALLPFVIAETLALAMPVVRGRSFEERLVAGAALLVPVGFGLGAQVPALLRLLRATGRPGWEALVWGVAIAASGGGFALAHVASRVSGDGATAALSGAASLACFLGLGLRWIDDRTPSTTGIEASRPLGRGAA